MKLITLYSSFNIKYIVCEDEADDLDVVLLKLKRYKVISTKTSYNDVEIVVENMPNFSYKVHPLTKVSRTQFEQKALLCISYLYRKLDTIKEPDSRNRFLQQLHHFSKSIFTKSDKYCVKMINLHDWRNQWFAYKGEIYFHKF